MCHALIYDNNLSIIYNKYSSILSSMIEKEYDAYSHFNNKNYDSRFWIYFINNLRWKW